MFVLKETASVILSIFCIAVTGYFLGSIRIKGVELGTAALFISGLFFRSFWCIHTRIHTDTWVDFLYCISRYDGWSGVCREGEGKRGSLYHSLSFHCSDGVLYMYSAGKTDRDR